jgi:hypothetical protein
LERLEPVQLTETVLLPGVAEALTFTGAFSVPTAAVAEPPPKAVQNAQAPPASTRNGKRINATARIRRLIRTSAWSRTRCR